MRCNKRVTKSIRFSPIRLFWSRLATVLKTSPISCAMVSWNTGSSLKKSIKDHRSELFSFSTFTNSYSKFLFTISYLPWRAVYSRLIFSPSIFHTPVDGPPNNFWQRALFFCARTASCNLTIVFAERAQDWSCYPHDHRNEKHRNW